MAWHGTGRIGVTSVPPSDRPCASASTVSYGLNHFSPVRLRLLTFGKAYLGGSETLKLGRLAVAVPRAKSILMAIKRPGLIHVPGGGAGPLAPDGPVLTFDGEKRLLNGSCIWRTQLPFVDESW